MDLTHFQTNFFSSIASLRQILDIMDQIPGAMFMIKNVESRYLYMSRALRTAIHVPLELNVVGCTDYDFFPAMIAESFRHNDLLVFREGRTLLNEIHASGGFGGPRQWFFSSKFPLSDQDGRIVGLVGINSPYDEVMGRDAELNQLLPAIEHISHHFDERVTIAELADVCQLSESHFMRVFKQRMKMTAHEFLEQVRLYHALDAIKHSQASIASIAHACGFYDHSAFVKRFRKLTGTTPLRYRRDHQQPFNQSRTMALPEILPPGSPSASGES